MRSSQISKRVLVPGPGYNNGVGLSYLHSDDRTVPPSGGIGSWPVMTVRTPTSVSDCCRGDRSSLDPARFGLPGVDPLCVTFR
ncbi:hypothetical protein AVEN_101917-1 [Araneus ventricosus]|uniref:Uncharacterized protein n=1 Tax=Araneus ventricosus TaxID=182803 RepID=A0A4Y2D8E1_ARAVE|nr:hypothetical protein AVEN_101917-1 [Araneus ventricosus]